MNQWIEGTFIRRARKSHRCRRCKLEIVRGEHYAEYVGESPVYQSGTRYCMHCAESELSTTESLAVARP